MADPITIDELRKMKAAGADVEIEQEIMSVVELPALIEQIKRLSDASEAIAHKDVSSILQSIAIAIGRIQFESAGVDMAPVLSALEALKITLSAPRNVPRYTFTVNRDARGRIENVVAEPSNG